MTETNAAITPGVLDTEGLKPVKLLDQLRQISDASTGAARTEGLPTGMGQTATKKPVLKPTFQ